MALSETSWVVLLLLAVFLVALYLGKRQVETGRIPDLRSIPAFNKLQDAMARAIEAGRALHISLGTGGIADNLTADSLAGLTVLEELAKQSAATGVSPIVTMADPTLLPVAQDVMRRAYQGDREGVAGPPRDVRWLAPQPAAYAAGVMGILGAEDVEANVMVGAFGDEYLLMGEAAKRHRSSHIGAASDPSVLPFVYVTADEMLMGEEMYAAGAYLSSKPWHMGSLLAQDVLRWIIVLAITGLVVVNTVL